MVVKGGGGSVPIDLKKLCYTLQQWKECAPRRRIFGVRPDSRALFFNSCIWTFTTVLFWCLLAFKNSVHRKIMFPCCANSLQSSSMKYGKTIVFVYIFPNNFLKTAKKN